jgi:hypothetical protein
MRPRLKTASKSARRRRRRSLRRPTAGLPHPIRPASGGAASDGKPPPALEHTALKDGAAVVSQHALHKAVPPQPPTLFRLIGPFWQRGASRSVWRCPPQADRREFRIEGGRRQGAPSRIIGLAALEGQTNTTTSNQDEVRAPRCRGSERSLSYSPAQVGQERMNREATEANACAPVSAPTACRQRISSSNSVQ